MNSKVPLEGAELEAHLEAERVQKEKDQAHQAALDRSRRMLEADDLDTDSESGSEAGDDAADGIIIAQAEPDPEERLQMSFDIYVKGQQTRVGRTGVAGEMARFRMFPFVEGKRRKIDAYGEGIDLGLWIRRGREIEEEGETEEVREKKRRKLEEEEKQVGLFIDSETTSDCSKLRLRSLPSLSAEMSRSISRPQYSMSTWTDYTMVKRSRLSFRICNRGKW